jgi:hypothetical protein
VSAVLSFAPERTVAGHPALDFCLWPYDPPAAPHAASLGGVNLLYAASAARDCLESYQIVTTGLRQALGPFRTVWGVKWNGAALSTEFYFYDYNRLERAAPFVRIAEAFAPLAEVNAPVNDGVPYFMVSLELPMAPRAFPARVGDADIYVGNPGSQVSSGICYQVSAAGTELKNFYFFFDARTEWDSIAAKAACSAHIPLADFPLDTVLPPELRDCRVIVIANKRRHDAAYFSGIGIRQLIWFLKRFQYPRDLIAYAEREEKNFAHLSFDVGFDYRLEEGRLVTSKSSFYNVL